MTSLGETRVRTAQGLQQVGEHDEDSCSVASPLVLEEGGTALRVLGLHSQPLLYDQRESADQVDEGGRLQASVNIPLEIYGK